MLREMDGDTGEADDADSLLEIGERLQRSGAWRWLNRHRQRLLYVLAGGTSTAAAWHRHFAGRARGDNRAAGSAGLPIAAAERHRRQPRRFAGPSHRPPRRRRGTTACSPVCRVLRAAGDRQPQVDRQRPRRHGRRARRGSSRRTPAQRSPPRWRNGHGNSLPHAMRPKPPVRRRVPCSPTSVTKSGRR
jgi:hypothetical protein